MYACVRDTLNEPVQSNPATLPPKEPAKIRTIGVATHNVPP